MLRVSAEFTRGSRGSYSVFKITRWAKNSLGEMQVFFSKFEIGSAHNKDRSPPVSKTR